MPTRSTPKTNRPRASVAVQAAVAGAPSAALLRRYAREASHADITLRVVGRLEGRKLNKRFRQKDYPANVLSFPYGKGSGDIVLCHPIIAQEARTQRKSLRAHYAHLVVHGVLHLRGLDHLRARDAKRMERREIAILRRLGFGNPYELK
jgi:probable rRNA maturation factor